MLFLMASVLWMRKIIRDINILSKVTELLSRKCRVEVGTGFSLSYQAAFWCYKWMWLYPNLKIFYIIFCPWDLYIYISEYSIIYLNVIWSLVQMDCYLGTQSHTQFKHLYPEQSHLFLKHPCTFSVPSLLNPLFKHSCLSACAVPLHWAASVWITGMVSLWLKPNWLPR